MKVADIEQALKKVEGSSICTVTACELQVVLGGKVVGFLNTNNKRARVCPDESGHDFLVLDDFIVDWWAHSFHGLPAILDRKKDAELVAELYGDPTAWEELSVSPKEFLEIYKEDPSYEDPNECPTCDSFEDASKW